MGDHYNRNTHRAASLAITLLAILQVLSSLITTYAQEEETILNPASHQQFADELTSRLYTNSNECSSSLGISMAFSLIYPGTTTDVALDEVQTTFGYPMNNLQLVWEDTTNRMLSKAAGQCVGGEWNGKCSADAPTLQIANSIWFNNSHTLNATYNSIVGEYAKQINFETDESPIIVNEWVSNSTNGMINSIVDEDAPLFPPYVLIAINSIYLKARWVEQFNEFATNVDKFYTREETESVDAHFMNIVDFFQYSHSAIPGYQIVELPFAESKMSMIFVLPQAAIDKDDLSEEEEVVTSSEVISSLDKLNNTRLALSLPKFKFESEYDDELKEALMDMGVVAPFTDGAAALCGIFQDYENCESLLIDKIVQKTIIDVNEKGVEAAAVTAAMAVPTSMEPPITEVPILMILDHPFQFFIYDRDERVTLFEGRLGEPEVPEVDPEVPLFDGEHSSEDFWSVFVDIDPVEAPVFDRTKEEIASCSVCNGTITVEANVSVGEGVTCGDLLASALKVEASNVQCDQMMEAGTSICCPMTEEEEEVEEPTTTTSSSEASSGGGVLLPMDPAGQQKFADELTAIIHTNSNDCSSSLGVSMALSLVWPGCLGDGIEQLRDVLGYPDGTNMRLIWEDTTIRILKSSSGECLSQWNGICEAEKPVVNIANSVWLDSSDTLNPQYGAVVRDYAIQTDFKADESPVLVNEWVENSTNGLINSIVPDDKPLFPPYVLLAINSIYLKASWRQQFEKRMTTLGSFYDSSSKSSEVGKAAFMHNVEYYMYSDQALQGHQVIDLPFDNSQMSMIFVLPTTDGANAVTSTDVISAATNNLDYTRIELSLPKFKFESKYEDELKSALIQLGIEAPFTDGTGALCGIFEDDTGCEDIVIDKVIQKTVIDVNEEGVEAAAVTMVGVSLTSVGPPPEDPVLMIIDHPFQFFIYDKDESLMLFEGRIGNPGVPEGFEADETTTDSIVPSGETPLSTPPAPQPEGSTNENTNLPLSPTTSQPTDAAEPVDDTSSGNVSSKRLSSFFTRMLLAFALTYAL